MYSIIYVRKIVEGLVRNLSDPITCSFSDRRERTCVVYDDGASRLGTLKYNSFRRRYIIIFNRLPKAIRMPSSCSVVGFESQLDSYLRNIVDRSCRPGFKNSLNGGDCYHGGHYADDMVANWMQLNKSSKGITSGALTRACTDDKSSVLLVGSEYSWDPSQSQQFILHERGQWMSF